MIIFVAIVIAIVGIAGFAAWLSSDGPVWVVDTQDWPASTGEPMDPDEVLAVLDEFQRYYPAAVASLAETEVPAPSGQRGTA